MSPQKRWIVTASDQGRIGELERALSKLGFVVDEVYREIGSIIGAGSDAVAAEARAIPGVADVSPETSIDIGPPDAPETW